MQGVADRVVLGLLPSSTGGWPTAVAALKPDCGGWLHVHENVTDSQETQWIEETIAKLTEIAKQQGFSWQFDVRHKERVKWYAPHIRHIVLDIECRPVPAAHNHKISVAAEEQ